MIDFTLADLHQVEIDMLERALGLDVATTSSRNFAQAEAGEDAAWDTLVDKGLAREAPSRLHLNRCFMVTPRGAALFGVLL